MAYSVLAQSYSDSPILKLLEAVYMGNSIWIIKFRTELQDYTWGTHTCATFGNSRDMG